MITQDEAATFERCIAAGGVCIFPADTVYGLACSPDSAQAAARLYELKGRPQDKPAAVMFFHSPLVLEALPGLGPRTGAAVEALLPGAVTLLLPNPDGLFPEACGPDRATLGVRCPALGPAATALAAVHAPVMQSSANHAGGPDPHSLDEIPREICEGADLALDAGPLPGVPSTVLDLRRYELAGAWSIVRAGAVSAADVQAALGV